MDKKSVKFDYLIVGAGFAGATLARKLAEHKKRVLIIDRRDHIGGNSYDYYDKHGVLVHKYGPHYFRTDIEDVWKFLSKFTKWRPWRYIVKACVGGKLYDMPINLNTINKFYKKDFNSREAEDFIKRITKNKKQIPKNSEEQVILKIGKDIYDKFFKNYTMKQWGIHPRKLDASVTARIPIRFNTDERYFESKHQAMPLKGYCKLFKGILSHHNIEVRLKTDFFKNKNKLQYDNLIYTGCIDEFFNYKYGKLPYRSLKFKHKSLNQEFYQEYSQINYPNDYKYTRIVEIKHATGQKIKNTTIVKEYPMVKGDPYYPIPMKRNEKLYAKYKEEADKLKNIYFVGRLAQYKYLNMDQVIKEAINLFNLLIDKKNAK